MQKFIFIAASLFWMQADISANAQPANEEKRREQVWSLFQGREPKDVRCNGIAECHGLIDAFLKRSEISFLTPALRAQSPSDGKLQKALASCLPKDIGVFTIDDSIRYVHTDKAVGPVALYAPAQQDDAAIWRIEFEDLRRISPPKGKPEPFHGIQIIDRATCAVKKQAYFNQDGLIDSGFVRYREQDYHYLIGQPPGMTYYFVLLEPGGPEQTDIATGLYLEMR